MHIEFTARATLNYPVDAKQLEEAITEIAQYCSQQGVTREAIEVTVYGGSENSDSYRPSVTCSWTVGDPESKA